MSEMFQSEKLEPGQDRHWIDIFLPASLGLGLGIALHIMMGIGGLRPTIPHFLEVMTITLWFIWQRDRAFLTIGFAVLLGAVLALPLDALYVPREGSYEAAFWHAGYWRYMTTPFVVYIAISFFLATDGGRDLRSGYRALFDSLLRLPILVSLSAVFSGIIWGFLFLWAEMFTIIEIDFFEDMLGERWFYLPFSWALAGLSIALMRGWSGFVKVFRDLVFLFCTIAAPLIAFFAITFLAALPFSGLEPLWKTPSAAGLTGVIAFTICIIVNCVRQDGSDSTVRRWLRWSVVCLVLTAPFYAAISGHAVWLRIDQYGFTPERMINGTLVMVILVYSLLCVIAFLADLVGRSRTWLALYAPINIVTAISLALIFILFHTPVLDPLEISAQSQLARLLDGDVEPDKFEVGYMRFHLGRPGENVLDDLRTGARFSDEEVLQRKIHIAMNTPSMWAYKAGQRDFADVEELMAERYTIYQLDLPQMRFRIGDYGLELLERLASVEEHPDASAISEEAERAHSAKNYGDYSSYWRIHSVMMRFTRREAPLRDLNLGRLYCMEKKGEEALAELRQMTDHPDHETLLAELTYLETTGNVQRCQQRWKDKQASRQSAGR